MDQIINDNGKRSIDLTNIRKKKKPKIIEYEPNTLEISTNIKLDKPFITELYHSKTVNEYTRTDNYVRDELYPTIDSSVYYFSLTKKISPRPCYICKIPLTQIHWFYLYQCPKCGDISLKNRYLSRNLTGMNAIVIGGRIKLGYQIALKLLRAGAKVMITTRNIENALEYYLQEPDYNNFRDRLYVYSQPFDLSNVKESITDLVKEICEIFGKNQLDIVIQNAAQTINFENFPVEEVIDPEKILEKSISRGKRHAYPPSEWRVNFEERYGRKIDNRVKNTWNLNIFETSDNEIEAVIKNNLVGSILIDKYLIPEMRPNPDTYVIHVHAKEGMFDTHKTLKHMHTNIAKAGLAMLTRCLAGNSDKEPRSSYPQIHGINPGWFSIDEYTIGIRMKCKIFNPPIDEIDAAARVLYPIFTSQPSYHKTWIHYQKFSSY
ncbi:putative dehydrogenase [Acanthamoeba polyphaga moumouvirus]|uniref:Putative dehydrogenase n=1 Tax=Acanthamoeba polyphaga moumouvirus TaxID=1269028 RepID=L7RDT8_9VIRU|nr:putative dehydrogenase [Acanthamoeba polyphaga moumouvirus]AGC02253.1 putative dehydrogenase [Acanthamoeba polyphaga moumouvirus]